jgi:hypothetical protein
MKVGKVRISKGSRIFRDMNKDCRYRLLRWLGACIEMGRDTSYWTDWTGWRFAEEYEAEYNGQEFIITRNIRWNNIDNINNIGFWTKYEAL